MPSLQRIDGQHLPALPSSHYVDNRIYFDESVFALERERLFSRVWKFVCHASELPAAGNYRLARVADRELIVLRVSEGDIRAFYNSCAHRGARILREPAGCLSGGRMTCFYHLWSYDLSGRCVTLPEPDGFSRAGISRDRVGLRAVRVETIFDLVFVCLDDEAPPLEHYLGPEMIEAMRVPFGCSELEVFHFHRAEIRANWKLFVETNCDGYHELLHTLNRTTAVAVKEYRQRRWHCHGKGHAAVDQAVINYDRLKWEERDDNSLPGMAPSGHIVVDIFPDVMLNCRSTVVRIDSLVPVDPVTSILECRGLGLKGDREDARAMRVRHHNQVWGPTGTNLAEDIWAVETQMANIRSRASRYSIFAREEQGSMDDEPLRHFYAEWRRLTGCEPHCVEAAGRV